MEATIEKEIYSLSILDTGTPPQGSGGRHHKTPKTNVGSLYVSIHMCVTDRAAGGGRQLPGTSRHDKHLTR